MKLIYCNESHLLVGNAQNIVESLGIKTLIKNEFSQGAIGEVAVFDSWPELWVWNDSDYLAAHAIVNKLNVCVQANDWVCKQCNEVNAASFELCWKCGSNT